MKTAIVIGEMVVLFSLAMAMLSCEHSNEPHTGPTVLAVQMEIIPDSCLPRVLDSTFYTHDATWGWDRFLDTASANQFADSLTVLASVTDMWFPNEGPSEIYPMRVGSDLKVKLSRPDTAASRFGLIRTGEAFLGAIASWRHYKFRIP